MQSQRHHLIDVKHSQSARGAGAQAKSLRDRLSVAGLELEQEQHGQDSVVVTDVEPTSDADPLAPPELYAKSLGARKSDLIGSYRMIGESHSRRVGFPEKILERCSWCKKRLPETTNLYMYGYELGVYCSVECRERQMALDRCHIEENMSQRHSRLLKF